MLSLRKGAVRVNPEGNDTSTSHDSGLKVTDVCYSQRLLLDASCFCTVERHELATETVGRALARSGEVGDRSLADYRLLYRRTFAGQHAVERLIGWGMFLPSLFDRALGRLAARDLGHTLVGVTGGLLPAREVLSPSFLLRMLL